MTKTVPQVTMVLVFVMLMATAASAQTPDRKCTTSQPDAVGNVTTTCTDVKPFDPLGDLQAGIKKRMQAEADRKKRIQEQADAAEAAKAQAEAVKAQTEAAKAMTEAAKAQTEAAHRTASAQEAAPAPAPAVTTSPAGDRMWTSIKSGRDFKVRIDGEYIYTQWVSMPPELQSTSAFMRAEFRKVGDKWVGKTYSYLPYKYKNSTKWCHAELDMEIDKLSDSRIEGMSPYAPSFNVEKCQPENVQMQPFTWIPK